MPSYFFKTGEDEEYAELCERERESVKIEEEGDSHEEEEEEEKVG